MFDSEDFCWYDLWDDSTGNYAYVKVNIDPTNMKHLEKEFMKENPRLDWEQDEDYFERFFKFLKEDDNIIFEYYNRPRNSIRLDVDKK